MLALSDDTEAALWKAALEAGVGVAVEGLSKCQRWRIRKSCALCPLTGAVLDRQSGKPLFIMSKLADVIRQYHSENNHTGRDVLMKALKAKFSAVPYRATTTRSN